MSKLNFLECDLEDIIEQTNQKELFRRGLNPLVRGNWKFLRQLRLGNYGIPDLVAVNISDDILNRPDSVDLIVFELKQNVINIATLLQVSRYIRGLSGLQLRYQTSPIRGVLIGRSVDTNGDFVYLLSQCENISVYTYSYGFDGIKFTEINPLGYTITNPGNTDSPTLEISETIFNITSERQNENLRLLGYAIKEEDQEEDFDEKSF